MTISSLFFPVLILGFLGFPSSVLSLVFFSTRIANYNTLIAIVDTISQRDKVFFHNLYCFGFSSDLLLSNTINKLLKTGNLKGYKVVADVVVIKDTLYLSEEDALREYKELKYGTIAVSDFETKESFDTECCYCHTKMKNEWLYCPKCGARNSNSLDNYDEKPKGY